MTAWTNATAPVRVAPTATSGGVLRPEEFEHSVHLERWPPSRQLDPWVENHWGVRWSLPAGVSHTSSVLPHPTVHLTVEHPARAGLGPRVVTGVPTRRYDTVVTGQGGVRGTKFRPGSFTVLTGVTGRALRDATVDADTLLPAPVTERLADVRPDSPGTEAVAALEAALIVLLEGVPLDSDHALLLEVMASMVADSALVTVQDVARTHGITARRLQRLFTHYVGVGPKWVLARIRMHDVVTAMDTGFAGSLADLAAEHGWYDQAHFARDFTRLVGVPPSVYRARGVRNPAG